MGTYKKVSSEFSLTPRLLCEAVTLTLTSRHDGNHHHLLLLLVQQTGRQINQPSIMVFRPCIDIHAGKVKQIVGSSLTGDDAALVTNFEAIMSAADFAT